MDRTDLSDELIHVLRQAGGSATPVEICKGVWARRARDLEASGDLFYRWQYDIRWEAYRLRRTGILKPADQSPKGIWEIAVDE